jgi:N-acetylglucosaminyl-diphospho-decaprenol L-rhamnosyltransferase
MSRTAVVTTAHGRHDHLRLQHRALLRSTLEPDDYVVVAMDDPELGDWRPHGSLRPHVVEVAADPLGLPLARARNLGAQVALERGADVLVFLDVDCLPGPELVAAYVAVAHRFDHRRDLLCGPVAYLPPAPPGGYDLASLADLADPHPGRPAPAPGEVVVTDDRPELFWSLSFALGADLWHELGGFDEAYVGYGAEDTDFGRLAEAAGVPTAWVGAARAYHQHHAVSRPPVEHVDDIVRNAALFHERWGEWPMTTWLDAFVEQGLVARDGDGYVRVHRT